ncbi:unnamed protein product, partial [marine sediment metagenome]
ANNRAPERNGIFCSLSGCTVINSIVWGHDGEDFGGHGYQATYSDIEMCLPGEGNICEDPHFVDPANGDYHLQPDSPCIDAGTNEDAPEIDFEGDPRPFDGDSDGVAVVDMGADEWLPPEPTPTPTSTPTSTPTRTPSPTVTGTATPSPTPGLTKVWLPLVVKNWRPPAVDVLDIARGMVTLQDHQTCLPPSHWGHPGFDDLAYLYDASVAALILHAAGGQYQAEAECLLDYFDERIQIPLETIQLEADINGHYGIL